MSRLGKLTAAQQFAGQLHAELDRKGWTIQDLVRALGGSPMPYKWLKGSVAPRVDTRRRLADTLGISMMAFEQTPLNGHATNVGQPPPPALRPATDTAGSPAVEMELVKSGPTKTVTVHLKFDALVTPGIASAVMLALEGR
jgi:hypothetical protein